MKRNVTSSCLTALALLGLSSPLKSQEMEKMWGDSKVKNRTGFSKREQRFDESNYAMFIHWGLYSKLANKVDGKTYYGIGEWIMNYQMANISVPEYKKIAKDFNPVKFDATAIAQLAKDAGMKYIVITSKHHDGFAMYHSKSHDFNIVDATPFGRDPMKELAEACRKIGIGFGFYYSHNQDWVEPGGCNAQNEDWDAPAGNGSPNKDEQGMPATFDDYFKKKCLPQVEEITSEYGPIEIVWFDTPDDMPKHHVEQLVKVVRKNQPNAMISGRAGHNLGDYQTLGDMEVPIENVEGLWETVDTTNDSWAFAWYDENWKSPSEVLRRVIATVARGGTYMLNIGLRGDGSIPERAAVSLRAAGEWINCYPQVIYSAGASPWKRALPWGDVTTKGDRLYLSVYEWPKSGELFLPGLKTPVKSAKLLNGEKFETVKTRRENGWTCIELPPRAPEKLISVIEVELTAAPDVDPCFGIDPGMKTEIAAAFSKVQGAKKSENKWMEKFGEWKHLKQVTDWEANGAATWEVDVLKPGDYKVSLTYAGEGRLVWKVAVQQRTDDINEAAGEGRLVWPVKVEGGETIQNQQNSSHNYQGFPIGWLNFPKPGRYKVSVSCIEGNLKSASLKAIDFVPVP